MTKNELNKMAEEIIRKCDAAMTRIMGVTAPTSAEDVLANVVALKILAETAFETLPPEGKQAAKMLETAMLLKLVGAAKPRGEAH